MKIQWIVNRPYTICILKERIAYLRAIVKCDNARVKALNHRLSFLKGWIVQLNGKVSAVVEEQSAYVAQIHSNKDELKHITE